jgi:hypothetical protein
MAYCRAGLDDSDAYCYADTAGGYTVWLTGADRHRFATASECADFLEAKRKEGLVVPQYAIDELRKEAEDEALEAKP